MDKKDQNIDLMHKIVSLAKRRGFIFPGSEIYGGLAGTYDFGPLGVQLKKHIKDSWWKKFIESREDMYGVDAAILMNQKVWEATGHVDEFHDMLVEDTKTNKRYRADHLLEEAGLPEAEGMTAQQMTDKIKELGLKSPNGNDLGDVKQFNMMLKTSLGASEDSSSVSYLRPETAQGIFVNYKNVLDTMNPKIPFGIGQIGKAFRNEITPKDFIFRVRELEQMEIEYFIKEEDWEKQFTYWLEEQREWFTEIGLDDSKMHEYEHPKEARSHYSKRTMDWEFDFPFGRSELCGLAYRTDFDLTKHAEHSKQKLQYTDSSTGETFVPHVIEPSFGLDRTILALLLSAYEEEEMEDGTSRVYLKFKPSIAPILCAVSPLVKNKPEIVDKARSIFGKLKSEFGRVVWDDNGNVGKRYRRQDEIGTPFGIVIDYDTLEGEGVTIRDRNTGEQERVKEEDLVGYLKEKLER
ncbi:MAG: glycyl-tRNA synthetase [Candidatus Paceibacteria bacterium]|jgi:glycyl-tRNA synthetase